MAVQAQLPAADLNLHGHKEEGMSKGQRPALGLACHSLPHFPAVKDPLFLPVVVAEMLSRELFWGTFNINN